MAINRREYDARLTELREAVTRVRGVARERGAINSGMQKIADDAGDSSLELTAEMKAALLNDQLALTLALQPILDAAVAAITA